MLRIGQVEATATQDGKYTDGSVAGGIAATRLRAAAFNAMQEELAHIVESAGLALDINDMTQVLKAIQKLTLSRANPFADIKSDGAAAISTALTNLGLVDASGIVGRLVNIQVITSTQQYVPTTGARRIISILTGGGAGGAPANATTTSQIYSGGGGGAGGTAIGIFTLSAISNFLVTVGSGGASNNAGGNSTAFGMTARGGFPGTNNVGTSSSAGGFGSDSSGGLINISGGDGGDGQAATRLVGGTGGSSFWGGSGRSGSGNGAPGKAPGSGGGGARDDQLSGTAYTGGTGADGICLILEFA